VNVAPKTANAIKAFFGHLKARCRAHVQLPKSLDEISLPGPAVEYMADEAVEGIALSRS
jgi:hypothetical protein